MPTTNGRSLYKIPVCFALMFLVSFQLISCGEDNTSNADAQDASISMSCYEAIEHFGEWVIQEQAALSTCETNNDCTLFVPHLYCKNSNHEVDITECSMAINKEKIEKFNARIAEFATDLCASIIDDSYGCGGSPGCSPLTIECTENKCVKKIQQP